MRRTSRWLSLFMAICLSLLALVAAGCGASADKENSAKAQTASQPSRAESSDASMAEGAGKGKSLVLYYSLTGTTERVARQIQQETGADILKVEPVKEYPTDYDTATKIAKQEQEEDARPAVKTDLSSLAQYNTIYLGYPIWWNSMPMFFYTILESGAFDGKTVIPFATSGGSSIDNSVEVLEKLAPKARVKEGLTANSGANIKNWLNKVR